VLRAGRSVQMSPTECDVSEFDHEALAMRIPWSTRGCRATKKSVEKFVL
jgi:hypothetical protein